MRFQLALHGIEPPPEGINPTDFQDSAPTPAWRRTLELNAKKRRN